MRSMEVVQRGAVRSLCALGAALVLTSLAAAPADASPDTLRRALGNIFQAPLDLALSPVVAGVTIRNGLRNIEDTRGVRIAYPVPGFIWNTGVQIGAACIREFTGLLELVPGIGLYFFETDLDPLYAPVERGNALFEGDIGYPDPLFAYKFGIDYTVVPF